MFLAGIQSPIELFGDVLNLIGGNGLSLIQILNDLPEHIVEHYLTLLKLEKEVLMKNKRNILQKY